MNTLLLKDNEKDINTAAKIIKDGNLVGMPTETVYGLAANALDGNAVKKIFKAKGRPADNPLIVHIADINDIHKFSLVSEFCEKSKLLAKAFWPGALTIIMPKGSVIPDEVSAGLDTVGIRFPSHPVAQKLIKTANTPIAAPSANISGSPSPTTAQHVLNDLNGKIDAVLDGGECLVGIESTVITLAQNPPKLLRPGGVTAEQIEKIIGKIEIDNAVLNQLEKTEKAASPGMKYKHYAPHANVVLLKGHTDKFIDYINNHSNKSTAALCYSTDCGRLSVKTFIIGDENDYNTQAQKLFDCLREIDKDKSITNVYARCPETIGVGMAIYNRLIRAAGFEVIDLEKI